MSPTAATAARIVRSRLPDVDIPDTSITDYTFRAAPDDAERVAIMTASTARRGPAASCSITCDASPATSTDGASRPAARWWR